MSRLWILADNSADREKLGRAILDLVAERKMRKQKGASLSRWLLFSSLDESRTQRSREASPVWSLIFERMTDFEERFAGNGDDRRISDVQLLGWAFGKRDPPATGPRLDRVLKVPAW
jgi:hypothetical protein